MGGGANELTGPDFEQGVPMSSLDDGKPLLGHAGGEAVVVVRVGDDVHAIGATCTHYGGPLADGLVVGSTIRCPWHHACFDLHNGEALGAPALADLPCWSVTRDDGLVQVRGRKERDTTPALTSAPASVVMVGAGAAAAACAETLRKRGFAGEITMLGAEDPGPVDRPNLSKDYLAGNAPEEWIPLGSSDHWAELSVDLRANDPAVAIDTASKTVTTKSGAVLTYGALLYAPGSEPQRLAIEGSDLPHVFTMRTLADSRAVIAHAEKAKRAVVIGASFIGLEVAASLRARGLEVAVVGPDKTPLGRILGDEVGAFVQKIHEAKGTRFFLGDKPKAIRHGVVELESGGRLDADLVVLGVGVKPRTELAAAAGLDVDRGVVVDASLRASAPGVWAAGDVARYPEPRASEHVRIEHWVHAERQGQAAARAMLGDRRPYNDVPFFWSVHHAVTISYVGHAPSWDAIAIDGTLDSTTPEKSSASVIYRQRGKILAVVTINRDAVSLAVEAAMERGASTAALERVASEAASES